MTRASLDLHFHPVTGAQLIGRIVPRRPEPTICGPCTDARAAAWLKDRVGPPPRPVATMDMEAHRRAEYITESGERRPVHP